MRHKDLFTLKLLATLALLTVIAALGVAAYNAGWAYAEECTRELLPVCKVNVRDGSSLRVRANPNAESKVLHLLAAGSELAIIRQVNGWALVNDPDLIGKRDPLGWVHTDYLVFDHRYVWSK